MRPYKNESPCLVLPRQGTLSRLNSTIRQIIACLMPGGNTFRLYDLRHACALLLLLEGVPTKVVSEWLGHSGVTLTPLSLNGPVRLQQGGVK